MNEENVQDVMEVNNNEDMSIEEYRRRLEAAEQRALLAENDATLLRECVVRMSLERYGILR